MNNTADSLTLEESPSTLQYIPIKILQPISRGNTNMGQKDLSID